jgi:hypothetical protein
MPEHARRSVARPGGRTPVDAPSPGARAPHRATLARLQASAGNHAVARAIESGLLQRVVQKRANPKNLNETMYASSLAPGKLYATEAEASKHDAALERQREQTARFNPNARAPTLYTDTPKDTKLHTQIPLSRQGPHTVAHADVGERLDNAEEKEFAQIFAQQIPAPSAVRKIVTDTEKPGGIAEAKIERYLFDYTKLYEAIAAALKRAPLPVERLKELLGAMLDLHPYATYSWKSGTGASSKSLGGKGEGSRRTATKKALLEESEATTTSSKSKKRKASELDEQDEGDGDEPATYDVFTDPRVDTGGLMSFNDRDAYRAFLTARIDWLDNKSAAKKARRETTVDVDEEKEEESEVEEELASGESESESESESEEEMVVEQPKSEQKVTATGRRVFKRGTRMTVK